MHIGVPTEIKSQEYRVGLSPDSVKALTNAGHRVFIQTNAGLASGFSNEDYKDSGAIILDSLEEIYSTSDMVVKVKEPMAKESALLRENQILFTYLHLAASAELTLSLLDSNSICIAYETVTDIDGKLPLLVPMSEIAGRLSVQAGAHTLEKPQKGRGVLLGGVSGIPPGKVLILGGGTVGENAAEIALGMQAEVSIVDRSQERLDQLQKKFEGNLITLDSEKIVLEEHVKDCDLLIGAVLIPGGNAPKLISRKMISTMKEGSVAVDVAIDQGGCFETSEPTTHENPTYLVDGVVHYCVANIPGAVPRTATLALNKATLPFILKLANDGYKNALMNDSNFLSGLNLYKGNVTHKSVANDLGMEYINPSDLIKV